MEREKLIEEAGVSEYEMRRNASLYEAKDKDGPVDEVNAGWFFKGFDAGYSAASAWVPVSERLPEKPGIYAVVIPTPPGCSPTVTYDAFHENGTWTYYQGHIAWMPIPPFGGTNEN